MIMARDSRVLELAEGIFRIATDAGRNGLSGFGYLLIDGNECAYLDPGSAADFDDAVKPLRQIVDPSRITWVIAHNHSADLCSAIPLLEKNGFRGSVVLDWPTMLVAQHYGIHSPYYMLNEHDFALRFASGRILQFIPAPYLPCAGSVLTFDTRSKILFTGDLFGASGISSSPWSDSSYPEAMRQYHEHVIPSRNIMAPLMNRLQLMDVSMIAPHHGSVIRERISDNIRYLHDLECGGRALLSQKQLGRDGTWGSICDAVFRRFCAIFPAEEVLSVFEGTPLPFSREGTDIRVCDDMGAEVWDRFFAEIAAKKSPSWLVPVEPLVRQLVREYGIPWPAVYSGLVKESHPSSSGAVSVRAAESAGEPNHVRTVQTDLANSDFTGLHNDAFFRSFLEKETQTRLNAGGLFSVMFLSVDNLAQINNKLGKKTGDEILIHLTYLINNFIVSDKDAAGFRLFKAEGPWFALFMPDTPIEKGAEVADRVRVAVSQSAVFLTHVTVSAGVVCLDEFRKEKGSAAATASMIHDAGMMKGRIAQKKGPGSIYYRVDANELTTFENFVLIADPDTMNLGILSKALSDMGIPSVTCEDGSAALSVMEKKDPQAVICELMLPKIDAFRIKEQLNRSVYTKGIPFILIAHDKSETLVAQSLSLGISYFFKKPCHPAEIAGITRLLVSGV